MSTAPPKKAAVRDNRIIFAGKALTERFAAVDSFHLSESRQEIVFSVKRKPADSFDLGLVATEGSAISWVPAEPVDEVKVQWAPRGNKISYVVRAAAGDLVRTLHIPTSFQVGIDFPYSSVRRIEWDQAGEKFTISYSTPVASEVAEVMTYQGDDRRTVTPPTMRIEAEVEPAGRDAILLRPADLTYNERVPLVTWVDADPYAWSDARAKLFKESRVGILVARALTEEAQAAAKERSWIDAGRTYVVGAGPAVVQSNAARRIADELKRNSPTNGSR